MGKYVGEIYNGKQKSLLMPTSDFSQVLMNTRLSFLLLFLRCTPEILGIIFFGVGAKKTRIVDIGVLALCKLHEIIQKHLEVMSNVPWKNDSSKNS